MWLLAIAIIGSNAVILTLYDLLSGGQRSGIARYLFPTYLLIQLAIAYLFASRFSEKNAYNWLWRLVFMGLIALGIFSCKISADAPTWWHKYSDYYNAEAAAIINQSPHPLVIGSSDRVSRVVSLSYQLNPQVQVLLLKETALPVITAKFSDIFLFRPTGELYQAIEQNPALKLHPLHPLAALWQIQAAGDRSPRGSGTSDL
ncbi:MAG: hypothetical protein HC890_19400 [Chloroflexaceae bacterium]|nr:hypothetical protein [Chloroflexaceae bacterium]